MPHPWNWPYWMGLWVTFFPLAKATPNHHPSSKYSRMAFFHFELTVFILFFSWVRLLQIISPSLQRLKPQFSKRNMGEEEKRMRHSYDEGEIYGNKDKCPCTYQHLKLRLMIHLCFLQAQASLSRIEHEKDTCNVIELSNKSAESADQQTKHQLMLFHDLTHQKGPITL